jgi:hypothetical protein
MQITVNSILVQFYRIVIVTEAINNLVNKGGNNQC